MKIYDLVAVIEVQGRDKPQYVRCGFVNQSEKGRWAVKLDSVPVGNWNGWLSCFEPKPKDGQAPATTAEPDSGAPYDDSIPF